jgi:hypothetical protein
MSAGENDYPRLKRFRLGEIPSYEVLADDFDRIKDEAQDIGLAFHFAVFCLSVAITISVTLVTVPIENLLVKAIFILVSFGGYVLGLFFLIQAFRQRGRLGKMMQRIRDRQVAPLGEKGGEIGPAESQQLPSEPADSAAPEMEEKI